MMIRISRYEYTNKSPAVNRRITIAGTSSESELPGDLLAIVYPVTYGNMSSIAV